MRPLQLNSSTHSSAQSQPVRVWRIPLLASDPALERSWSLLSEEERHQSARFKYEIDRHRYVQSHGAMREILARETGCAPHELRFVTAQQGKPSLQAPFEQVQFNLSHSAEMALLVVSRAGAAGIDVEFQRPLEDLAGLIAQVCSPAEERLIADSADAERLFYQCWVGKEAVLKCVGRGLTLPLREFEVLDAKGDLISSLVLPQEQGARITLRLLHPLPPGFVGALSVLQQDMQSPVDQQIHVQDWVC